MCRIVAVMLSLLFAAAARADVVASMENVAGGVITLTDETSQQCSGQQKVAFATDSNGKIIWGCWTTYARQILLTFSGRQRLYPPESFQLDPAYVNRLDDDARTEPRTQRVPL